MPAKYTVIQYVPDAIVDERINIGVIAFNEDEVRSHFLSDWRRVRSFSSCDIEFLRDFAQRFSEAEPSDLLQSQEMKLNAGTIESLAGKWNNTIQITPPRASLKTIDEVFQFASQRFLHESIRRKIGFRDRKIAASITTFKIRNVLQKKIGVETEDILKCRYPLQGTHQSHRFDAVVQNGVTYFAAHGLSFEGPDKRSISTVADAVAWAIKDVKSHDPKLPLAIVTLPPESGSRLEEAYKRSTRVYKELGAEVFVEKDLEPWALRMSDKIHLQK